MINVINGIVINVFDTIYFIINPSHLFIIKYQTQKYYVFKISH